MVLVAGGPNDGEDEEEQVDDVQVEVEGGEDVLLRGQRVLVLPPEHHLRVEHDVLKKRTVQHQSRTPCTASRTSESNTIC